MLQSFKSYSLQSSASIHQIVVELPLFHMALSACARITAIEGMAMSSLKLKYFEYVMLSRVCREDVENLEETLTPTEIASPASDVGIEDISLLVFTILDLFCKLAYLLLSTSGRERHCVVWHCHHRSRVGAQDMFTSKNMKRFMVSLAIVVIIIVLVSSNPTYGALLRPTMNICC